jgi:hypothetical protein
MLIGIVLAALLTCWFPTVRISSPENPEIGAMFGSTRDAAMARQSPSQEVIKHQRFKKQGDAVTGEGSLGGPLRCYWSGMGRQPQCRADHLIR